MRWNPLRQFLTMAMAGLMCIGGLPYRADADERVQPATLSLSGLIQESLARNPEIQAVRKQWEAVGHRIKQAQNADAVEQCGSAHSGGAGIRYRRGDGGKGDRKSVV